MLEGDLFSIPQDEPPPNTTTKTHWWDEAKCATYPRELTDAILFPEHLGRVDYTLGQKFCTDCPVKTECANEGKAIPFGVWGGLTPQQRGHK